MTRSIEEISRKLDYFEDLDAIMRLRSKYYWCLDNKLWDEWAEIFTEDVEADFTEDISRMTETPADGRIKGRDKFIQAIIEYLPKSVIHVHKGAMPKIDFTGPTTATGRWQMFDILDYGEPYVMMGYGHYFDEYVKLDGEWKICRYAEKRLHVGWYPKQMLETPMIVSPLQKKMAGL